LPGGARGDHPANCHPAVSAMEDRPDGGGDLHIANRAGDRHPAGHRSLRQPRQGRDMTQVTLDSVSRRFGPVLAVADLTLAVEPGEFLVLLGPSGCGKTTTLRMIAGFLETSAGRIRLGSRDITNEPPWRRNIGFVFQNYALFPHLTVR